jgi:hypothetical protein
METTTAANFTMFTKPSFIILSPAFPVAVALLWPSLVAPRLALENPDSKSAHDCLTRDRLFNSETTWTQFWWVAGMRARHPCPGRNQQKEKPRIGREGA